MSAGDPLPAGEGLRPRLTASIMTHDSLALLPACVAALSFCDEIVLVDDRSTDGTQAWAAAQGLRVCSRELDNLPNQRRFQRDTAAGEWLLIIDADEVVTPALAREIRATLDARPTADAFFLRLDNVLPAFWPRRVHYRTGQKRLLRRSAVDWAPADWVHAPVLHAGRAPWLQGHMVHHSFDSVPHLFRKQLQYGLSGGRHLHARGKRTSLFGLLGHALAAFLKFFFGRGLCWQGPGGLIVATALTGSTFIKYATLWELQHGTPVAPRQKVPGER